ncbi:hypothetical protein B0H14DRAFT_3473631 [Mycena olivaceomarginata]|nr:hypothetical protein B0H14DRAFT_3473631 [Mycena olivaceomarginata]
MDFPPHRAASTATLTVFSPSPDSWLPGRWLAEAERTMEQPFIVVLDAFMPFSMGPSQLRREEFGNERDAARRLAHISGYSEGQYGLCRQQSRRSGGAAVWSIAEALPSVAAYGEMHAHHGAPRSVGECIA